MTAHTAVVTNSGTILSISATLPESYDAAGYSSTDMVYTPVGNVEDHGSHGVTANVTKFIPVDTAVVAKAKGSKDYGQKTMKIANVAGDSGFGIMKAAAESTAHYSLKITYSDGETHYLDVLISKFEYNDGSVDNNRTINCTADLCRAPVIVAAV